MTKEQKIQNIDSKIENLEFNLQELYKERQTILDSTEITFEQLVQEFIKEESDIVKKSVQETQSYRAILGGDGRSQPYDKMEIGKCLNVSHSDAFYINDEDKIRFIKFLKLYSTKDIKAIFINQQQV